MKKLLVASLLALGFTTGFTCSKNTPAPEEAAPAVEATPEAGTETVPMDEAAPVEGQPAGEVTQ